MLARCFMVARLASMKRSTQLARQVCSVLSSAEPPPLERPKTLPPVVVLVTHFFQQIAVSSWVSVLVGVVSFVLGFVGLGEGGLVGM
jgi:hypothetical protein